MLPSQASAELLIIDVNTLEITTIFSAPGSQIAYPRWSPTGDKISFLKSNGNNAVGLFLVNSDGSDLREIVSYPVARNLQTLTSPTWSIDGSQIAFAEIVKVRFHSEHVLRIVNSDGSNLRSIIQSQDRITNLKWINGGSRLAFIGKIHDPYNDSFGIYLIDANGSNLIRLLPDNMVDTRVSSFAVP